MAEILVAEDNSLLLQLLETLLSNSGHKVTTVSTVNEALHIILKQRFDLVITDLIMPDRPGIELVAELNRSAPRTKIIVISGKIKIHGNALLSAAMTMGVTQFLPKPFTKKALFSAVSRALNEALPVRLPQAHQTGAGTRS